MRGRSLAARVFFTLGSIKNCRLPLDFGKFYPVHGVFLPVPHKIRCCAKLARKLLSVELTLGRSAKKTGLHQRFS